MSRDDSHQDSKLIRPGELKWHLKNYNCRHIFLGGSHDNGYARVLKELAVHESAEDINKIRLLEGPPFSRELAELDYQTVKFPNVFSPEKFDAYAPSQPRFPPPGLTLKRNSTGQSINNSAFPPLGTPSSYAAAVITAPILSSPQPMHLVTRGLPKISKALSDQAINEAVKRIKNMQPKPCNNFYLKGDCQFAGYEQYKCKFGHEHKLNNDELVAMGLLAKTKLCTWGEDCKIDKCYYSHEGRD